MSAPPPRPEACAAAAVDEFNRRFARESAIAISRIDGPVIHVTMGGNACASCCLYDYFDDFISILESQSGQPHALWDAGAMAPGEGCCHARVVRLDFLGEVRRAMDAVGKIVEQREAEFQAIRGSEDALFSELCFCILTANYTAEGGLRIQQALSRDFPNASRSQLAAKLKAMGHRFPNKRAEFISEAQCMCGKLGAQLKGFSRGRAAREWLADNVKGMGFKEASHFLRNAGFKDVAIIDRHILSFLASKGLIGPPKALTRRRYIEIELLLSAIAIKLGITQAELDLYLWYLKTGKVLK